MTHRRRILLWGASLLAAYALVGFLVVPPILKSVLTKQLTAALHRDATIREVRFNPFTLSAAVRGLAIKERQGPGTFASLEELDVNLQVSSVFQRAVVIKELQLVKPFIRIVRRQDQVYNMSDLLQGRSTSKPLRFSVNNIRITDGGADFLDETVGRTHTVRELNVGIPFLSNIPSQTNIFVKPAISAVVNGTRYAFEGKTKPFADSLETSLDVNIADLDLPYYFAYIPKELRTFELPSGQLDANLSVAFARHRTGGQTLEVKGEVAVRNLAVEDSKGDPVVRLSAFKVGILSAEPLTRTVHLSSVSVQYPELTIRREKTGTANLQTLLPPSPSQPTGEQAPRPDGAAFMLDVDEISIAGAKVLVSDLAPRLPFRTVLNPIDLKVAHLSTRPNASGTYSLSAKTEAKEELALAGTISLTPLLVEGTVAAKSIPLKRYAPYYADNVLFDIESGKLDLSARYRYATGATGPEIAATQAAVSVTALRLRRRNEPADFLRVPALAVQEAALDLGKRHLRVASVSTKGGTVFVSRSPQGEVNLARLFSPPAATAGPPTGSGATPAAGQSGPPARPWTVEVGGLAVTQYHVQIDDATPPEPFKLPVEDVNLKARNLSTVENGPAGKLSLRLRLGKGTASAEGAVRIAPLLADLHLAVQDIDIRPFEPYFTDRVKVTVADGRVSTNGRLELQRKDPLGLQATYTGETSLDKFVAIEKDSAQELLRWDSLALHEISAGYNPFFIRVKQVAAADFFARVIVEPDRRLNLQEIMAAPEPAAQPAAAPAPDRPANAGAATSPPPNGTRDVQIDELTLQGGRVQFQDRSIQPNYSTTMTEIGGRVTGLSSVESSLADVELRGKMNDSAPLEITGKVNPLKRDLYADLKARFAGMDLSPASPYSEKYAGYTIAKGKLDFNLAYHIDRQKLSSENKIFLDQLTLGDKVESPTATRLPVKLAVALLKDRNGEIHLDIPVTGSLSDPKFSLWGIIKQAIWNVVTKAVTSPFALLGSAFGHGEDLQYVEFDPGRSTLSPEAAKKIATLSTALSEKPSLRLDITGYVDPEADQEGLKHLLLQRKVKAQKLKELVKNGAPAVPVDEVGVAPDEYERYLTLAYRAEKFPKPRNFIGLVKSLPVPEMEKLMLTHIQVGDEELRQLAAERANAVRNALLQSGKIAASRLFVLEPKGLSPAPKDNEKDSRVEFKIA